MIKAKSAEEIMIPLDKYPHISCASTLREIVFLMEESQIEVHGRKSLPRAVLVFDESGKLVGSVRRRDILRALEPGFLSGASMEYRKKLFDVKVDPNLAELSYDKALEGLRKRAERPACDVMLPIITTVNYDDHIMKVIYEMVDNNLSLLPVVKQGKVIGIVRSVDAFHEVAQILL